MNNNGMTGKNALDYNNENFNQSSEYYEDNSSKKKVIVIISVVLIMLIVGFFAVRGFFGNDKDEVDDSTVSGSSSASDILTEENKSENLDNGEEISSTLVDEVTENNNNPGNEETTAVNGQSTQQTLPATVTEILSFTKNAVNKTKNMTGDFVARRTQNYDISITDVPGGDAVKNIANGVVEKIAKPVDETLNFTSGKAEDSSGNSVSPLLPLNSDFSLTSSGIANAKAERSGSDTIVTITLIKETGTVSAPPTHNAASVGYMDVSGVDFGIVKMETFDVTYTATTITFTINAQGYVTNAVYSIPFTVDCVGKVFGISANVSLEGTQTETWSINM